MARRDDHTRVRLLPAVAAVAFTAVLTCGLAACGSDTSGDADASTDPSALVGKTYVSDESTSEDVPGGGPLVVRFGPGGQLSASGGCNGHGGTATFDGDTMTVGNLVGTMMACPPPRDTVDAWIAKVFDGPVTWSLSGRTLTLTADGDTLKLDERVARAVAGTTWRVTGLVRDRAVETSAVLSQVKPTVRIGADGTFTGYSGCNQMHGDAVVSGSGGRQNVAFGPIATTRKACVGEAGDVEKAILAVLDGDVTAVVDGDELRLTNVKDPTIGLRLTATSETGGK